MKIECSYKLDVVRVDNEVYKFEASGKGVKITNYSNDNWDVDLCDPTNTLVTKSYGGNPRPLSIIEITYMSNLAKWYADNHKQVNSLRFDTHIIKEV